MAEPRYQDLRSGQVGLATSPDGGALLRIISGELAGVQGPGETYTPATLIHATIAPGAEVTLPWRTVAAKAAMWRILIAGSAMLQNLSPARGSHRCNRTHWRPPPAAETCCEAQLG